MGGRSQAPRRLRGEGATPSVSNANGGHVFQRRGVIPACRVKLEAGLKYPQHGYLVGGALGWSHTDVY